MDKMTSDFSNMDFIKNALTLWDGYAGWPCFSPDGNQIVFTANADKSTCYLAIIDINHPHQVTAITAPIRGAKRPTWRPDGREIAYNVDNERIEVIQLDTRTIKNYISDDDRNGIKLIHPCYAPDGKSIIAATYQRNGIQREEVLYRVHHKLKPTLVKLTEYPHVCAGRLTVNPDNKEIVFAGHAGHFNQVENRLWKVRPPERAEMLESGGNAACHGRCPAYSPDGKWVACVSARPVVNPKDDTPLSVWIIGSDGNSVYKLTDDSLRPTHMAWSPNQKLLTVAGAHGLQLITLPNIFT